MHRGEDPGGGFLVLTHGAGGNCSAPLLVALAERGLEAEAEARASVNATYRRFMSESDPERKGEAGKALIRTVFGKDAIAEDPLL